MTSYASQRASYASQRVVAENWSGDDIVVENAPFTFYKEENGKFEINLAPWGYIKDLSTHILRHLDQLERSKVT